jgi:hypothetical protein
VHKILIKIKLANDKGQFDLKKIEDALPSSIEVDFVELVTDKTLVHCFNIQDIKSDANHILVAKEADIADGIKLFAAISNRVYFKRFEKSLHITSNNYHKVKDRFKEHLAKVYMRKKKLLSELNLITDELLMNAFFNAPVDADKKPMYKSKPRSENVVLEDRGMDISLLKKDDKSTIRCGDMFGSLSPDMVIKYIQKGIGSDVSMIPETRKGAGIGMSLMYNYSDALIFDIDEEISIDVYSMKFNKSRKFKLVSVFSKGKVMDPYSIEKINDHLFVSLKGRLDEGSDLTEINTEGIQKLIIDFASLSVINSCGIREWIRFIESLGDLKIVYKNCGKMVVDQMSCIKDFTNENVTIENLDLPYHCSKCEIEHLEDCKVETIFIDGKIETPKVSCPKCSGEMDFDEVPEQYFNFLSI